MIPRKKTNWRPRLETLEARRLLSVYADFNGDGFDDLAIGVPGEQSFAGAVHIIYGSATGLTTSGTQLWHQDSGDVLDTREAGDEFGAALASGDFNNDGRADLAIGAPGESIGAATQTGAVHLLYGSPGGLVSAGNQFFHQDSPRVREINETGDNWGSSLASGDFNGDGFADIVVGAPSEDIGAASNAGSISVLYGGPSGITPVGNQSINLDTGPMTGVAEQTDGFGYSLAAGDFNNDGRDDVAVGIPFKEISNQIVVGAASVIYGSATGLTASVNQFWHEDVIGMSSLANVGDSFGESLAAGDFDGDGRDDLAIGVPLETVNVSITAGSVHILYGTNGGLGINEEQFFNQGDAGGNAEVGDVFSRGLVAADFNGDGRSDLAIGAPGERVGAFGPDEAGAVNVMYGSASGITTSGAFEIVEDDFTTGDASEEGDRFGFVLSAGDFNGNGRDDLVVSAPFEDIGVTVPDTGRVWSLYGATSGFTGIQSWGQDTAGIQDVSETSDQFGGGLDSSGGKSAPDGGSGRRDLAHLLTADFDFDTPINKLNKRRFLSGRR